MGGCIQKYRISKNHESRGVPLTPADLNGNSEFELRINHPVVSLEKESIHENLDQVPGSSDCDNMVIRWTKTLSKKSFSNKSLPNKLSELESNKAPENGVLNEPSAIISSPLSEDVACNILNDVTNIDGTSLEKSNSKIINGRRRRLSVSQVDETVDDLAASDNKGTTLIVDDTQFVKCLSNPKSFYVASEDEQMLLLEESLAGLDFGGKAAPQKVPSSLSQQINREDISPFRTTQSRRRLSVSGCLTSDPQGNFDCKIEEVKGKELSTRFKELGIGYCCRKGFKPESPNQDDFFIIRVGDWGMYGVFDGHGPYGHDVSNFVQKELPSLIYNDSDFLSNPTVALRTSFRTVHRRLVEACPKNGFDCSLSGSTATVVLHRSNHLYVAHVGDSRAVIARMSKNRKRLFAVDLTNDHKPNIETERKRINSCGGQVRRLEGDIPYRVFVKGRLYPGLAMSRAIGDTVGMQAGIVPDPEVTDLEVESGRDIFFLMCSDGVWEFISSQEAIEIIHKLGIEKVQEACEILCREAWNRWIQQERNVVDDITAQVIYL